MTRKLLHDAAQRAVESRAAEPRREASLLPSRSGSGESAQASRAVLAELEASLEASQRALLGRDVASLEQCTSEQIRLHRSLKILWSRRADLPGSHSSRSGPGLGVPGIEIPAFDIPKFDNATFDIELRDAQLRVLHLGRIQAALLGRAQRWLRTVSHLLAGVEQNYVLPASSQVPHYTASSAGSGSSVNRRPQEEGLKKNEDGDPCRA
jgi:hypothetical protein